MNAVLLILQRATLSAWCHCSPISLINVVLSSSKVESAWIDWCWQADVVTKETTKCLAHNLPNPSLHVTLVTGLLSQQ